MHQHTINASLQILPIVQDKHPYLWVDEAIAAMPDKVKQYQSGKKGLIGLFAGEVKKRSKGKADMQIVNETLEKKLNTSS